MDVRDFYWWERKSRIENVRKKISVMGEMRLAMHGDEQFDRQIRDYVDQIDLWERPVLTDEQIVANWNARIAELKAGVARVKKGK